MAMADKKRATEQQKDKAKEDNQDLDKVVDVDSDSLSDSSVSAISAEGFPIEGESEWIPVMRGLAFTILAIITVTAAVFHFLTAGDAFVEVQQLGMMMGGLVFLLVLAYFFFLRLVIPRQADYGRYIINENQVNFYPLTAIGLQIRPVSEAVNISKFMGLTTGRVVEKKGNISYAVYLVHAKNKGKTINIKSFPDSESADQYAETLGNALRLNVVSGVRKTKSSVK